MNIVLDIDGTLIAEETCQVIPRPHLETFLNFCFSSFDRVAIWTAADTDWLNTVFYHLKLKKESFDLIFTQRHCTRTYYGKEWEFTKPLTEIYKNHPGYTQENTVVVDNTPITYAQNSKNAVPISTYYGIDESEDILLRLIEHLQQIQIEYKERG
jgi:TFIIF-interacting CTD phosphatase-like protein